MCCTALPQISLHLSSTYKLNIMESIGSISCPSKGFRVYSWRTKKKKKKKKKKEKRKKRENFCSSAIKGKSRVMTHV
jgi:hypothetical protein